MRTKKNPSNGRSFVIVAKGVCTAAKVELRSGKIRIERKGLGELLFFPRSLVAFSSALGVYPLEG